MRLARSGLKGVYVSREKRLTEQKSLFGEGHAKDEEM